jgi:2',3'-cyclic-nucleotide 2'-phosphodiesterase/3'-nucleotidase
VKKILRFFVILGLLVVLPACHSISSARTESGEFVTFTILTVNDFHGALVQESKNPGAIRLAHYLKDEYVLNPDGTLIVGAGDMFQGTIDSDLLKGEPVVSIMNNVGFDAMAVGNHELDWGREILRERAQQADFPFLAANMIEKGTNKVPSYIKPYLIVEKKGVKIAIIGIATPETAYKAHPQFVSAYRFIDPAKTVHSLLPELKRQGAEVVVVLSHLGCELDTQTNTIRGEAALLANRISGVAVIIAGHSHTKLAGTVNGIPIIQAGYNGRAVGKVNLVYSRENGKVISAVTNVAEIPLEGLAGDLAVSRIIQEAQSQTATLKQQVIGEAKSRLSHGRYELSPLGQWTTDSMREACKADIAFQNGGGIRTGEFFGFITKASLYQLFPFDNQVAVVEMTGAEIVKTLEYGIDNKQIGMLQFSGLSVTYDYSRPLNKRVTQVVLNNGKKLEKNQYYKVAVNDFMAAGGDGFTMFSGARKTTNTHLSIRQIVEQAINKTMPVSVEADNRLQMRNMQHSVPAA